MSFAKVGIYFHTKKKTKVENEMIILLSCQIREWEWEC